MLTRLCLTGLLLTTAAIVLFRSVRGGPDPSAREVTYLRVVTTPDRTAARDHRLGQPRISRASFVPPVLPQAFEEFDRWLREATDQGFPADSLDEGIRLATQRRAELAPILREDPELAWQLALDPSEISSLPGAIRPLVETIVSGEGDFLVTAICNHGPDGPHTGGCQLKHQVVIKNEVYNASVYGTRLPRLTEERASLHGVVLDSQMAVHEDDVLVREMPSRGFTLTYKDRTTYSASEEEIAAAVEALLPVAEWKDGLADAGPELIPTDVISSSTPPTIPYNEYDGPFWHQRGPKTVMVLLVRASDAPAWSNPPSFSALDSQLNQASQAYFDASYRLTWFGPKYVNVGTANEMVIPRLVVTPVLTLPGTTADYFDNFGRLVNDARNAAIAQGGVWGQNQSQFMGYYDRVVVMSNVKMISSTGLAYVGGSAAWTGDSLSSGVALHEFGHNWGVFHANLWTSSTTDGRSPQGAHGEYKDSADVMGSGGTLFNPMFRDQLGFLDTSAGDVQNVTSGSVYRLYNFADPNSRNSTSRLRGLRLPVEGFGDYEKWVLLGFRHTTGTTGGIGRNDWERSAVQLYANMTSPTGNNEGSHFIDTTPKSRSGDGVADSADGAVKMGRTWSEGANVNGANIRGGFFVTPVDRGSVSVNGNTHEYIDVRIAFADEVTGNQPPAIPTFSSTNPTTLLGTTPVITATAGVPVTITVATTDPDGDALAYDWNFGFSGSGSYNVTNSPTQTITFPSAGLYLVTVNINDGRGGTRPAFQWVNIGGMSVAPPTTVSTLSGLNYSYFEGAFSSMPDLGRLLPVRTGTASSVGLAQAERDNDFALLFEGFIDAPASDIYRFHLRADDGARLYINGNLIIDNSSTKGNDREDEDWSEERVGSVALEAGKHAIRVEYFHRSGAERLELLWSTRLAPTPAPLNSSNYVQNAWDGNAAPVVAISAPQAGARLSVGATAILQASASDANGIARVQYFSGGTFLGESTSTPFSVSWPRLSAGAKTVVAYAYDTTGRRTASAPVTFNVQSPPLTGVIGINLVNRNETGVMFSDRVGAVHDTPNWNNITAQDGTFANGTVSALRDHTGTATTASISYNFRHGNGMTTTSANTSDGPGRMFRHGFRARDTGDPRTLTVTGIPFVEYDVYVYFDSAQGTDHVLHEYRLDGISRFGRNASTTTTGTSLGDYPNYESWIGFKEAGATTAAAPLADQLGNYFVWRNRTNSSITLDVINTVATVNGLQIVQVTPTVPRLVFSSAGAAVAAEGGASHAYGVALSVAPTANVTITLNPASQLALDRTLLTFTPENWDTPQTVTVGAVDDTTMEGTHSSSVSHTVAGTGNYAGLSASSYSVAITDNDQPSVTVDVTGLPSEDASSAPASFRILRSSSSSFASPVTVSFTMTGTADRATDYTLSGNGLTYNSSAGVGSVVIPAGSVQTIVTATPVNDSEAERRETIIMTLTAAGTAYSIGTPSSATASSIDNDGLEYLAEEFSGSTGDLFDLSNTRITFTPDGSPSFYRATLSTATSYNTPTSTPGMTNLTAGNNGVYTIEPTRSADPYGSFFWERALPTRFFGVQYPTIFINPSGGVTFDAGTFETSAHTIPWLPDAPNNFFAMKRIAGFWRSYGYTPGGNSRVWAGRVTNVAGQERTVVTYDNVTNGSANANFQIELYDNGVITITWLSMPTSSSANFWGSVGLTNITTGQPEAFLESDLSIYPREAANTAPAIVSVPVTFGRQGQAFAMAAFAADLESTPTLTAPVLPSWLAFTPGANGTGTLTGTPPSPGAFAVTLRASDGSLTGDQIFTINVASVNANHAPVFTSSPVTLANQGAAYSYTVTASDADGQPLTLSRIATPPWLTFTDNGNGTGTLSGTAPVDFVDGNVTLGASDGIVTTSQSFILQANRPPGAMITAPSGLVVRLPSAILPLRLTGSSSDDQRPSPSVLTRTWTRISGPGTATFSSPSADATEVRFSQNGIYVIGFTVSDGVLSSTDRVTVAVGDDPSTALANGLLGYWRLNDATGTSAADSSAANSPLSLLANNVPGVGTSNGLSWTGGYEGYGITSNGATNVALQYTPAVAGTSQNPAEPVQWTISAWMWLTNSPDTASGTVFAFTTGTSARSRIVSTNGSRRIQFVADRATTDGIWEMNADVPGKQWFHLAVAYDSSNVANDPVFFLNGAPVTATRVTAPVGARSAGETSLRAMTAWRGNIDEIRLYNRALSAGELPMTTFISPINRGPFVSAGPSAAGSINQPIALNGTVEDDGLPAADALSIGWEKVSGPGDVGFDSTTTPQTTAQFSTAGTYVLRLTASDTEVTSYSEVQVTVQAPPAAATGLTATAGPGPSVSLAWTDIATTESGYIVERRTGTSAFALIANLGPNSSSFVDSSVLAGTTYTYRIVSVNSAGSTPSTDVSVSVPADGPTFNAWIEEHPGLSGNQALPGADPDGDGLTNFLEYALGGSPELADPASILPALAPDTDRLRLAFCRIADPGLIYIVEGSDNLISWEEIWRSSGSENTSGTVSVEDIEPADDTRFLRLRITIP